jgi:hypothetical protein
MHELSKHNINISNKTLQRGLVLPRESTEESRLYPGIVTTLQHNPFGTPEYKRLEA